MKIKTIFTITIILLALLNTFCSKIKVITDYQTTRSAQTLNEEIIIECAKNNDLQGIKQQTENGINPNVHEEMYGISPLMYAAQKGYIEIVKYLTQNFSSINQVSPTGATVLMHAMYGSDMETIKYLVENGADINKKDTNEMTALMHAAIKGNLDVVKYLIDNGANPDATNIDGLSPSEIALKNNNSEIVEYLNSLK